jgi:predicted outer membrane repeat protein
MTNNMAASSGGVVYAVSPGARVALAGSSFSNNTARILGGVVSAKEAASVRLDDCQFANNTADLAAGVVYARDADMVANGCTFTTNSAKRDGGALYCAGEALTLTHVTRLIHDPHKRELPLSHPWVELFIV